MNSIFKIIFGVSLCATIILCAPWNETVKREEFNKHKEDVKKFPCQKPQYMVINSIDLFNNTNEVDIKPPQTMVKRCQNSGCCILPTRSCQPIKKRNVKLVFSVLNVMTKITKYVVKKVESHNKCECQSIRNIVQ